DLYSVRFGLTGVDQQFSRFRTDVAHRLHRVDDQVEHHLLQLHSISLNERQAFRELRPHPDAVPLHFAFGQLNDLEYRFVDLQALPSGRRPLHEAMDPAQNVYGSVAIFEDATERLPNLLEIWRLRAQP